MPGFRFSLLGLLLLFYGCSSSDAVSEASPGTPSETPAVDPSSPDRSAPDPASEAPPPKRTVEPLSLDGFLDEELPAARKKEVKLLVDNDACYVCHGNYRDEKLVVTHGRKGVGCADCHGESDAHRNDEDNITPPDVMYPRDGVDRKCSQCHEEHDVAPAKVVQRWRKRCPDTDRPICTDCHFKHRLSLRTVRWDKKTRKLLQSQ